MKNKHYIAIGTFVVGAIALIVLCIMLFGAGNLFDSQLTYTTSFDKSVNGLNIGAPVMFRGIKIGEVTDIKLSFNTASVKPHSVQKKGEWPINVHFTLFPNSVAFDENRGLSLPERIFRWFIPGQAEQAMENWMRDMVINRGLCAQLQTQNYLTGMLFIQMDLFQTEKSTNELTRLISHNIIPSRISSIENLFRTLNQNNFSTQAKYFFKAADVIGSFFYDGKAEALLDNVVAISKSMTTAADSLNSIVNDFKGEKSGKFFTNISELSVELNNAAKGIDAIVAKVNQPRTEQMLANAASLLKNSDETVAGIKTFIKPQAQKPDAPSLEKTVQSLNATLAKIAQLTDTMQQEMGTVLKNANTGINNFNQASDPNSKLMFNMNAALEDVRQASQTLRSLAEMLSNSPEALIRGRND